MTGEQLALRAEIFRAFAATGSPPELPGSPDLRAMAERHVVVLDDRGRIAMRLLRSEEAAEGETVALRTLAALARDWYGDRLDPAWRPRGAEEAQRILGAHGLTGPFWRLG